MDVSKKVYILKEVIEEANDIKTFRFIPEDGDLMQFSPGQFVQVELVENKAGLPSRQYSITSTAKDEYVSITVKKIGGFSGALHELAVDEKVYMFGPLGNFSLRENDRDIVLLAGGIGIAPFFSMIKHLYEQNNENREVYLFYSNKEQANGAFRASLAEMEKEWKNLHIINVLTQTDEKVSGVEEYNRVDVPVIEKYVKNMNTCEYYVCGSVPFVTGLSKKLEDGGITQEQIFAELFY